MEDSSRSSSPSFLARIIRKPLAWVAAIIIVVPVLLLAAFPFGAKYYLQKWLLENGAETAVIEKIRFNPFTGTISLVGADVQTGGEVVYSNSTIMLDLGLGSLFKKKALLERAVISDLLIDIERLGDGGMRLGSYTLSGQGGVKVEQGAEEPMPSPWIFHAAGVDISNLILRYRQPDLSIDLHITEGSITGINTSPDAEKGSIRLVGTLNKAPFSIEMERISVLPELMLEGRVSLAALDLGHLSDLLEQHVKPFSGVAGLDGALSFRLTPDAMDSVFDGGLTLQKIAAGGKGWSTTVGADWSGKIHCATGTDGLVVETDGSLVLAEPAVGLDREEGGKLTISNRKTSYTGTVKYAAGPVDKEGADLELNGLLSLSKTGVDIPDSLSFEQDKFALEGGLNVGMGKKLKLRYQGDLAAEDTALALKEGLAVGGKKLTWQGNIGLLIDGEKQEVTLKGRLDGADLEVNEPGADIHVAQSSLGVKSDLVLIQDDVPFIKGKLGMQANGLEVKQGDVMLVLLDQVEVVGGKGDDQGQPAVEGLTLTSLTVPRSEMVPVEVKVPDIALKKITFPEYAGLKVEELALEGLEVIDEDNGRIPAGIASIVVNDLAVDRSGSVTSAGLGLSKGEFLRQHKDGAKPLVTLGGLETTPFSWSKEQGLVCDKVVLDSLLGEVSRQKNGEQTAEKAAKPQKKKAVESGERKGGPSALPVKIGLIELTGHSGFVFSDQTLKRPFTAELLVNQGRIENIDLNQPEQPFTYSLKGVYRGYAPVVVNGKAAPLAEKMLVDQKVTITNFPLQLASPYVVEAIGTFFESGRLNLTSEMKVSGDMLDMKNDLLLKDIKTKTVNSESAEELNSRLPVPLDTALYMMEDSKGHIALSIPLSGTFAELKMGFGDVVLMAFSKSITLGVTPYLAYTVLGPTGALVFLGAKLGESLLHTELTPLQFEKGVVELTEEQKTLLQATGESILKDKEETYSICAKVALSELGEAAAGQDAYSVMGNEESRKMLFELGDVRSRAIKQYLLENFAIPEEQLLICNPGVEYRAGAKSVVEFKQ